MGDSKEFLSTLSPAIQFLLLIATSLVVLCIYLCVCILPEKSVTYKPAWVNVYVTFFILSFLVVCYINDSILHTLFLIPLHLTKWYFVKAI